MGQGKTRLAVHRGVVAGALALAGGLLTTVGAGTAYAATTWNVAPAPAGNNANNCTTNPCATISGVLAKATFAAGDTINVAAGTYVDRFTLTRAVTINGAGQASTIINGNAAGPVNAPVVVVNATSSPVTINGVTLRGGFSHFGAGLQVLNGTVVVNDSTVTANKAAATSSNAVLGGGGVGVLGSVFGLTQHVTLNRVTVSANTSTLHGGGIYNSGTLVTNDVTVNGNSASSQGGGIYLFKASGSTNSPTLTTADTTMGTSVTGNSAGIASGSAGGGIVAAASTTLSTGTLASITGNTAVNGGGLYVAENGTAILDGTDVGGNKALGGAILAGGNGGGIFNSGALTIKNGAVLNGNQAVQSTNAANALRGYGGAIINATVAGGNPALSVSGSTISGGLPSGQFNATFGGGIAQYNAPTPATITGSTLSGNVGFLGGALYAASGASVSGSALTGNVAVSGGGAYVAPPQVAGTAVTFTGGTLNANIGSNGGALTVAGKGTGANPGKAVLDGVSATGNLADGGAAATSGNGGAVFNSGALTIRNGSFAGNRVKASTASGATTGYGGTVFTGPVAAGDAPTAMIEDSTIAAGTLPSGVSNHATFGGGVAATGNIFGAGSPAPVPSTLALDRVAVTGTKASQSGGGVYDAGAATLSDTVVSGSSAGVRGGGISVVAGSSPLTMTGGALDGNTATIGGGLYVQENASATLDSADLTGNQATSAAGGSGGGAVNSGSLVLRDALVSGNTAVLGGSGTGAGGGVYSGSNAVAASTVTLTLEGDTFTGNSASSGSAVFTLNQASAGTANSATIRNSTIHANTVVGTSSAGAVVAFHPMKITASTITANTSPAGSGGIYGAATTVAGTILSGNSGPECGVVSIFVAPTDGGHNLSDPGDTSCGFSSANDDIAANPQLGPLTANGGPTPTRLPGASSPAINAIPTGTAGLCDGTIATDQRGTARPQGAACDIGAVEAEVSAPTVAGPTNPVFTVGTAGSFTYTTTGVPTADLSATGALPAGLTFVDNGDGTATLSGTPGPNTGADYPITVTAANGESPDATLPVVIRVNQPPTIAGASSATYYVNHAGAPVTFTTTGFPTATLSQTGTLPPGVTFEDNGDGTAALSGAPTAAGTFPITVRATNGVAPDATHAFTLTVEPPVTVTTTTLSGGKVGEPYSATLAASGGLAPYAWSVSSGSLPGGLTLSPGGVISGTPTGPVGTVTFTVQAADSLAPSGVDTQELSITIIKGTSALVVDPVVIQTAPLGLKVGIVRATLTGGSAAVPLAGQTVVFKAGTATVCTGVTNAQGVVTCTMTVANTLLVILNLGVSASFAGNALYEGSSGSAGLL